MPWQRDVSQVAGEIDPATGEPAYSIIIVSVQRQAGKTAIIGPTAIQRATIAPESGCWYTAQDRGHARDNWMDWARRTARSDLAGCWFRYGNGSETIGLPNMSTVRVFAPADDALHGKATRLVVIDEAWAIPETIGLALEQAILPTFNTVPGQLWIVSAAGDHRSTWLRRWVDAGRAAVDAGQRTGIAFFDWGIPEDGDPSDLDLVLSHHPAWGHTLRHAAVRDAAGRMTAADYARAYGNVWSALTSRAIPADTWAAAATSDPLPSTGAVTFGVDVAHNRGRATIVACGGGILEVVDHQPGVQWVAPRIRELVERHHPAGVALDSYGPAVTVVDELTRRNPLECLLVPTTREYAGACADLIDALATGRRRHRTNPILDAAVLAATTRTLGDIWVWGRRVSAGQIDPLVAATLASWAADHYTPTPPPRPRPQIHTG
jgi:hypothetical protein